MNVAAVRMNTIKVNRISDSSHDLNRQCLIQDNSADFFQNSNLSQQKPIRVIGFKGLFSSESEIFDKQIGKLDELYDYWRKKAIEYGIKHNIYTISDLSVLVLEKAKSLNKPINDPKYYEQLKLTNELKGYWLTQAKKYHVEVGADESIDSIYAKVLKAKYE